MRLRSSLLAFFTSSFDWEASFDKKSHRSHDKGDYYLLCFLQLLHVGSVGVYCCRCCLPVDVRRMDLIITGQEKPGHQETTAATKIQQHRSNVVTIK